MAITVGTKPQNIPQNLAQPNKPNAQASKEGKDTAVKSSLAPALKQAAQLATSPAVQVATQVATKAVGALLSTKA